MAPFGSFARPLLPSAVTTTNCHPPKELTAAVALAAKSRVASFIGGKNGRGGKGQVGRASYSRSRALNPACIKCSSAVSAALNLRSCITMNETQSMSPHSLSGRVE